MLDVDFRELYASPGHVSDVSDDAVDQRTYLDWVGLLRGAAAYEAYSKMYTANVHPRYIIEFLLLNPSFPYSVHFAINAAQRSLEVIGDATEMPKAARVSVGGQAAGHARLCQRGRNHGKWPGHISS